MSCLDCNDCNQSPIYPVNTALPGPPGASAFVYVAFAQTVNNIGVPSGPNASSANTGFVNNQPNANSAFIAIISTNTPFPGNPPAAAFNGYWVPLQGVTVGGINLQDDNTPVANGPFTTLDFRGAGLTGVTVTNVGGGEAEIQITTAGFSKTSYADLAAIVAGSTLNPGAYYWIVDAGDAEGSFTNLYKPECSPAYYTNMTPNTINSYVHTSGIIVRATSTNQFEASAIYLARVPASTVVSSIFILNNNYSPGAKVVSYGQVFEAISPNPFNADIEPADDPTRWDYVVRDNSTDYVTEAQSCLFEFTTQVTASYGRVRARWDNKGNYLKNTNSTGTFNEGLKKIFRWGLPSVHSNQINFYDDSTRRLTADTKRSPFFNISNTNYCNIFNFSGNHIDTNLAPGVNSAAPTGYYYGTRFINIFMNSNGEITNNVFDNAAIGKIFTNNANNRVRLINNKIENSVLYNVNFALCQNNNITNNSVIGDLFYKANDVSSQNSSYTLIEEVNHTTVTTANMQYGAGSKSWSIIAAAGTVTPSAPNTILNFVGQTTYAQVSPTADIIQITSSVPNVSLVNTYHTVQNIPTSSEIVISGVYTGGPAGALNANIFNSSTPTSFTSFSNNVISNSVIRSLNKNSHSDQCWFVANTVTRSFIENQAPRIPAASPANFFNKYSYSDPGLEFGVLNGAVNEDYAFSRNEISNCIFLGNKITSTFSDNQIKNAAFYTNAPSTNPAGTGFNGSFRSNSIDGERGQETLNPLAFVTSATGVMFAANNFGLGSSFSGNTLRKDVLIHNVTLEATSGGEAGAIFRDSKFEGTSYYTTTNTSGSLSSSAGLYNMTFARRVNTNNNIFEGRQARWENFVMIPRSSSDYKQTQYTTNISNITTRDFILTGTGKSSPYNQLGPQYFGAANNPIVNITNVTENAAYPLPLGAGPTLTYQVATFTLTVVTQFPHMMNNGAWVNRDVSLLLTGFTGGFTFVGPSVTWPRGEFISFNILSIAGVVNNIVDDYTFTVTITQNNGYYPLATTNTQPDEQGNSAPGVPGIPSAGSYVPANDTQSVLSFNYWFHLYQNYKPSSYFTTAESSIISHNVFEPQVRIALKNGVIPSTNTPIGGSRKFYVYKDYNAGVPGTLLYNFTTKTITLPHFFDVMSNTVVLGTSNAAVTYEVDFIVDMPEDVLVRFVALPGCTVQFNLQPVNSSPLVTNRIIDVNNQNTLTITSYFPPTTTPSTFAVFDEIILVRRGNYIKVDDRVIHTP